MRERERGNGIISTVYDFEVTYEVALLNGLGVDLTLVGGASLEISMKVF